jgi:hypothetical protein
VASAHNSLFDVDEDCIPVRVAVQCEAVLEYLTR